MSSDVLGGRPREARTGRRDIGLGRCERAWASAACSSVVRLGVLDDDGRRRARSHPSSVLAAALVLPTADRTRAVVSAGLT